MRTDHGGDDWGVACTRPTHNPRGRDADSRHKQREFRLGIFDWLFGKSQPPPQRDLPVHAPGVKGGKRPVRSGDRGWILNANATFPLTILGVDERFAIRLRNLMDDTEVVHPRGLFGAVAALVAQTGLRCKEIEEYVAQFREMFAAGKEPPVAPYCDLDSLFAGKRIDATVGGTLVTRYGFENLRFYCRHGKMIGKPRPIPSTHRDRKRFEELVRVGLATIGPSMTKAGKTGEAFGLNAVEAPVSLDDLASWIHLCETVAELITLTYSHSHSAARSAQSDADPDIAEILKGYKVVTVGDDCTCQLCARMDGKKYPVGSPPKVPFHIGCRCTLIALFD